MTPEESRACAAVTGIQGLRVLPQGPDPDAACSMMSCRITILEAGDTKCPAPLQFQAWRHMLYHVLLHALDRLLEALPAVLSLKTRRPRIDLCRSLHMSPDCYVRVVT